MPTLQTNKQNDSSQNKCNLQSYIAEYIDDQLSSKSDTFEKLFLEFLTMRCEAVLLLLVVTAVVLECCCASPAAFGDSEKELVRERRTRHTPGTRTEEEEDEEGEITEMTEMTENTPGGPSAVFIILREISNFISRTGNAGTNCVTQACFPFDAGRCLTCLALVAVAGIGK